MHGLVARPATLARVRRGAVDDSKIGTSRCAALTRTASRATTVTTYAGRTPFPVGTPDANGIVPGVGKGMPKWPEVWRWLNDEKKMDTLDRATRASS